MAHVQPSLSSSSLADVVDRILDRGIVVDLWAKASLVGIEVLSIEARIVIASAETYLKYAEAIGLTATAAHPTPAPDTRTPDRHESGGTTATVAKGSLNELRHELEDIRDLVAEPDKK